METEKACTLSKNYKIYLRCQKIACTLCAPETSETEMDSNYNPQHQVGICRDCQTKTQASLGGKVLGKESLIGPDKRKQWTREQKLEFITLYKKYNNKSRAARELQIKYKHTINSRTYNNWIANAGKIRSATFRSKKIGCGRKAFYPDMESLHAKFAAMREKGRMVVSFTYKATYGSNVPKS